MSDTASAPPSRAAFAGGRMFVTFGVSLTMTGVFAYFLAPFSRKLDVLGHLSDRRAHATFRHAVRATKVQFETIGTRVLYHRNVFGPGFLVHREHDGDKDRAVGPVFLELANLVEVCLQRAIGNQFDVVEPDYPAFVAVYGAVAWSTNIYDRRIFSECFPDRAAPARFKGAIDVVRFVRRRRGCEPERIRSS